MVGISVAMRSWLMVLSLGIEGGCRHLDLPSGGVDGGDEG